MAVVKRLQRQAVHDGGKRNAGIVDQRRAEHGGAVGGQVFGQRRRQGEAFGLGGGVLAGRGGLSPSAFSSARPPV